MQYNHEENGKFTPLKNKNVDTGLGVERVTAILEGYTDNYKSSVWKDVIKKIEEITNKKIINKIEEAEIIGAKHLTDIMVIAPCSRKHNWKTSKWNCRYTSTYGSKIKLKK